MAAMRRCLFRAVRRAGAEAAEGEREYFHYLNDHGNVYHLYNVKAFLGGDVPVGPAHLRDERFLDFFFAMLRENRTGRYEKDFPYVSHCRGELNYLRPSDRPIVFTELEEGDTPDNARLRYGGAKLGETFQPAELAVCTEGRLYHPAKLGGHGLLSAHCALRLGLDSIFDDNALEEPELHWAGRVYPIAKIPAYPPKFL